MFITPRPATTISMRLSSPVSVLMMMIISSGSWLRRSASAPTGFSAVDSASAYVPASVPDCTVT